MKRYQRYAAKWLGASLLVVIVVGGFFGLLASWSTEDGPVLFTLVGSTLTGLVVAVLLFKYVAEMVEDQQQTA